MGRFVSVHPLGVIVAIAMGVLVAGIPGALVAVPLAASVNAVVQHLAADTGGRRGSDRRRDDDEGGGRHRGRAGRRVGQRGGGCRQPRSRGLRPRVDGDTPRTHLRRPRPPVRRANPPDASILACTLVRRNRPACDRVLRPRAPRVLTHPSTDTPALATIRGPDASPWPTSRPPRRSSTESRSGPRWRSRAGWRPWSRVRSCSSARTSSAPARSRSAAPTCACPGSPLRSAPAAWSRPRRATTRRASRSPPRCSGIKATVFMPEGAPIPKVNATRGYGADVRFEGEYLTQALRRRAGVRRGDRGGVHPPLRPPRHRRRAGHRRPRDPRAGARGRRPCWCRPVAAACSPGWRSR